ncbi:hypothetical protein NPX13_g10424 [Xylaria arbuscula]|uniref:Uncharacterized protein n=1 Tax=Xylaria arbuscula TaxID=114810 RepID=A0A9W8N4Q9_9PEZI|nr:hypothetical protein NPX13_g10424 [Xylaria arbuscula]
MWIPDGGDAFQNVNIIDFRSSRAGMLQAVDEFYWLQAAIDNDKPPKVVFQLVNSTLNRLSTAMRTQQPDFFFQMLEILQHPWSNHTELASIFRRHVAELAVAHLGRNHPMSVLWMHLLREKNDDNANAIFRDVLELLLQELLMSKGPQDHLTCMALDYLLRFLIHTKGAYPSWKRFKRWLDAYPGWDDAIEWQSYVQSTIEANNVEASNNSVTTVIPRPQSSSSSGSTSAAVQYQRPSGHTVGDLHSGYLLPYLAGRISIRNGDTERAEGLFLRAKAVARQARQPHLTDYYVKAYTNLHVLYVATKQEQKLAEMHRELAAFKAGIPHRVRWPRENLPYECPDCV